MIDELIAKAAIKALADKYSENVSVNDMATSQRMGGKYTPKGLEKAQTQAELDADDRLKLKDLVRSAGGFNVIG